MRDATGRGLWNPLSTGLGVVVIVATAVAAWALLRPVPPPPAARFDVNLPQGLVAASGAGVSMDVSPDGSRIVFRGVSGGAEQLWQRHLDQLVPATISGTDEADNPRISPDDGSVAFTVGGGISTVSLRGGAPPLTIVADSVPNGESGLSWGPDGMLYFRKLGLGIWRVPANGGEEEEVTSLAEGESGHTWPDVLPNGRGILFTRDFAGNEDDQIAVLSLETGEIHTLFPGVMARYAQSGHIVYASGDGTLLAAPFDEERLEVTGASRALPAEAVVVTALSAAYFALSGTGSLVYQPRPAATGSGGLVWVNRDGSSQTLDPALTGLFEAPAFSPDGRKVALQRQIGGAPEDIWIYDLGRGAFTRLTFGGSRNIQPFWNPDGTEVGFSSDRDGLFALYARPVDLSSAARLLLSHPGDGLYQGSWTPDGRALVARLGSGATSGSRDLVYGPPDPDSTPVVIVGTPAAEVTPSFSPDGRWLAYASDESGRYEVYVRPFPGPGSQQPVSVDGGQNPKWAHSGREIFYEGQDGFVVATVRTEPVFAVESRARFRAPSLFLQPIIRHWDLAPDDQRLLAVAASSSEDQELIYVQNFFEELKRLMPN